MATTPHLGPRSNAQVIRSLALVASFIPARVEAGSPELGVAVINTPKAALGNREFFLNEPTKPHEDTFPGV